MFDAAAMSSLLHAVMAPCLDVVFAVGSSGDVKAIVDYHEGRCRYVAIVEAADYTYYLQGNFCFFKIF